MFSWYVFPNSRGDERFCYIGQKKSIMSGESRSNNLKFLEGGGEMGALTRAKDWSKTPVGPVEGWPQSLRSTLAIVLHSKFPMFLWWGAELICFYNDAYRPSLGQHGKHPSILGLPAAQAWEEIWPIIKPLIDQVLGGGESTWSEDQLIPIFRNGKIEDVYWTFSYSPVIDESAAVAGVLVTCTETTEKVNNLKKLAESEKRYRSLAEQAPLGILILQGEDFTVEMANQSYLELVDRTESSFVGRGLFESLPEVKEIVQPLLSNVLKTGIPYYGTEFPVIINKRGNQEVTYFNFVYYPRKDEHGEITGIIVTATDVTGMVNAKHALQKREARFRTLVMQSPVPMTTFRGRDMVIEIANDKMINEIWRKKESEVVGKKVLDVFPELKEQKYPDLIKGVFESGKPYSEKESLAYVQGNDGMAKFYLDFTYAPMFDEENAVSGIVITVNDVTDKVESRKALEESEARFRLLADSMPQLIWSGGKNGVLNYFNQSVYKYSGLASHEMLDNGWIQIVHPAEKAENIKAWKAAVETGSDFLFEHRFRRHDGAYRWQLSRAVPLKDTEGNIQMWVGTSTDIHDQKEFTNELEKLVNDRTSELAQNVLDLGKMNKELQSFAYISSHDLQEPLRKIQTFVSLIDQTERQNLSEKGKDYFNRITTSAARMQSLISDLLAYSRTQTSERKFEEIAISRVIDEVKQDLAEEIAHKHAIVETGNMITLPVIHFQLRQLFYNLISNSLKFASPKRTCHIKIDSEIIEGSESINKNLVRGKKYCHITVADNGIGFEMQYSEKIFELFQRLQGRNEYHGTGIGLAIVKKIVENHNGVVVAQGARDKGACFDIYLPMQVTRD